MGVTANQLTVLAIALSFLIGWLFTFYQSNTLYLLALPLGLLIRMALNALDGMMAREHNMQSKLGEVLNEIGDVVSDSAIIFPLTLIPTVNPLIILSFGVLAILNEFSGLIGRALGGERRYEGPMGKSDRALLISLFCIIYFFWKDIELYANWIFGIGSLLIVLSSVTRLKKAIK
jgi:CDP-diacylglycerol--glycerol-3-phosphate 3-phosphatidyltransferase